MPYIKQERRDQLAEDGGDPTPCSPPGELNYLITTLVRDYLGQAYTYADINEVVGVLECAKLELYRRVAAPYEDTKIAENGDVY